MTLELQKRTLLGPGPSDVHPRILEAVGKPTIGHLDPQFVNLMEEIKSLLKYAFKTKNEMTYTVSAPGSAGMETCFANPLLKRAAEMRTLERKCVRRAREYVQPRNMLKMQPLHRKFDEKCDPIRQKLRR